MAPKVPLVRLLTAVAVTVIACGFVSLYDLVSSLSIERGRVLPAITVIVLEYSRYAYVVPVLVLLLGLFFLRRRDGDPVGLECTISIAWLSALFWILLAVWAWQIPRIHNIAEHL